MKNYAAYIQIGNLAILARSDDRQSFDYLVQVALGGKPESANSELRKVADSTVVAIISEKTSGVRIGKNFKEPQTPEAMKRFMVSRIPGDREAAVDNYPREDKSILPILVQLIRTDDSITVRQRAVERFNYLTKQSFEFWKSKEVLEWWEKNRTSFQ